MRYNDAQFKRDARRGRAVQIGDTGFFGGASSASPVLSEQSATDLSARGARSSKACSRGFSLIEILVAVTLLSVITVGLLAMFYHTQRAFRLGTSQVDILEGGRATLRMVALDLQEMYPSRNDEVTNLYAVPSSALRIDMPLPNNAVMENLLQDVAFLTRLGVTGSSRGCARSPIR